MIVVVELVKQIVKRGSDVGGQRLRSVLQTQQEAFISTTAPPDMLDKKRVPVVTVLSVCVSFLLPVHHFAAADQRKISVSLTELRRDSPPSL